MWHSFYFEKSEFDQLKENQAADTVTTGNKIGVSSDSEKPLQF